LLSVRVFDAFFGFPGNRSEGSSDKLFEIWSHDDDDENVLLMWNDLRDSKKYRQGRLIVF